MPKKKRRHRKNPMRHKNELARARQAEYRVVDPPPPEVRNLVRAGFESGWMRWMPAHELLLVLAAGFENDREVDDAFDEVGLDALLWDYDPRDHDDRQAILRARADLERFATHAGVPLPETRRGLVDLLVRYDVVTVASNGRYQVTLPLPLVGETGVLTPEEVAKEDAMRWERHFEPLAQAIIRQFVERHLDEWPTTLTDLADKLEVTVDDARAALICLTNDGDFTTNVNVDAIDELAPIVVRVDWAAFDRNRITLGPSGET